MRYLGGGIGHLEQFPPADNNGDTAMNDDSNMEVETDDFIMGGSNDEGEGDKEAGENQDEEEGDEEAGEMESEEDDDEPGELSDEETGNVY